MDERVIQFRVGVFFFATLLITATLLVMFGKLPRMMGHYTIYIEFESVGGITKGTPIRKSGVLIGEVVDVKLTDGDAKVMITADIQNDKKIYKNEVCTIDREQLMGDTSLTFKTNPRKPGAGELVGPGAILLGTYNDDPTGLKRSMESSMDTINNTGQALKEAADALKVAANKVNGILDTEQTHIHEVLGNAADALKAIRTILGDQETQAKLAEAMQKLPQSLDSMNQTFQTANESIRAFTEPGEDGRSAVQRMINAITITENTMKRFSEGDDAPSEQLRQAIAHVNEITSFTAAITKSIKDGNGSLGALIKDRELYDRLNHAARNINEVTEKLKPIVDDARVISDKVARHPGVIIRDAVKPGPGIK